MLWDWRKINLILLLLLEALSLLSSWGSQIPKTKLRSSHQITRDCFYITAIIKAERQSISPSPVIHPSLQLVLLVCACNGRPVQAPKPSTFPTRHNTTELNSAARAPQFPQYFWKLFVLRYSRPRLTPTGKTSAAQEKEIDRSNRQTDSSQRSLLSGRRLFISLKEEKEQGRSPCDIPEHDPSFGPLQKTKKRIPSKSYL